MGNALRKDVADPRAKLRPEPEPERVAAAQAIRAAKSRAVSPLELYKREQQQASERPDNQPECPFGRSADHGEGTPRPRRSALVS
jgi:hypothetical protein